MNEADRCILDHFVRVRNRTMELAERIPAEMLERTPEGEEASLRWQLVHIADGPDWWLGRALNDGLGWSWPPAYAERPGGNLEGLAASRDRLYRFFTADDGIRMGQTFETGDGSEWTGRDRVLYLTEHEIHHRGRIVLALTQFGFRNFPGEAGEMLWPAAAEGQ